MLEGHRENDTNSAAWRAHETLSAPGALHLAFSSLTAARFCNPTSLLRLSSQVPAMAAQAPGSREHELGRVQISSLSWIEPAVS